jgi:hypothetical protein
MMTIECRGIHKNEKSSARKLKEPVFIRRAEQAMSQEARHEFHMAPCTTRWEVTLSREFEVFMPMKI